MLLWLWHQTLMNFFAKLGFERTLLEPCWLVKRSPSGKLIAQVLIEVDNLNFGIAPGYEEELQKALEARFTFGKWERDEADFAGRRVKSDRLKNSDAPREIHPGENPSSSTSSGCSQRQVCQGFPQRTLRPTDRSFTRSTGWHTRRGQKPQEW